MAVTITSRTGENVSGEIPFHKHCQKTVCSAYGYDGNGATWNILYHGGKDDLVNIQQFVSNWHNFFTGNEENITQDLRSILELIDLIAGMVCIKTNWNLIFKDCDNKEVGNKNINPWSGGTQDYTFSQFGRYIKLTIDGNDDLAFKFHTMRDAKTLGYGEENLNIDIPKGDLTINFNGNRVITVEDINMKSSEIVDINQDFNKHPTIGYSGSSVISRVDGTNQIYRYRGTQGSITPMFDIDGKYIPVDQDLKSPIIEWEFHIKNYGESGNINVNTPSVLVNGVVDYFVKTVQLTDKMDVEPGKTNVYVFRADLHSDEKTLTFSLAYIY